MIVHRPTSLGWEDFFDSSLKKLKADGKCILSIGLSSDESALHKGDIYPNSYILPAAKPGDKPTLKKEPSELSTFMRGMVKLHGAADKTLGERALKISTAETQEECRTVGLVWKEVTELLVLCVDGGLSAHQVEQVGREAHDLVGREPFP